MTLPKIPALAALALLACTTLSPNTASARPDFVSLVPNADVHSCQTCHQGLPPAFNPFGQAVFDTALEVSGGSSTVRWSEALANLDSDGDGVSNGVELGDPTGAWRSGLPAPGNRADVSEPGNADSVPSAAQGAPVMGLVGWSVLGGSLLGLAFMFQSARRREECLMG